MVIFQRFDRLVRQILTFGIAAAAIGVAASPAQGANEICLPLTVINGITIGAQASANRHSRMKPGVVSIAVLPGGDLRDNPEKLTGVFRKNGVRADCFINDSMFPNNGTEFVLYVAGNPVVFEGHDQFGIQELRDNPVILRTARAEATLAAAMLGN